MRVINSTTTIASGASASGAIAISPAVNPVNTIALFTYRGGNSNPNDSMIVYSLASDGSSISWNRGTSTTGGTITIAYTIIESTAFSVQRFSGNMVGSSLALTLSPAIDTTKSFPILYSRTSGSTFSEDEVLRATLSNSTATIDCSISTTGTTYDLQVVSSNLFSVQTQTFSFTANGSGTTVRTITSVDTSKSFLLLSHITSNSNNLRMGEKLLSGRFTSSTQVTVERQVVTAAITATLYVVTLPSAASVAHSGLYTFSSTTTPSTPTNPWNVAASPIAKSFPLINGSPNFNATNNVTSDDIVQAGNVSATIADDGIGGVNVTFQRTSSSGTAQVYASVINLPDSLDTPTDTIAPSGIASTNQFGSLTITAGDATISPSGIASNNQFGTAAITPGAATISPPGIPSSNQFGTPTISAGAATIAPVGVSPTNQFGSATLTAGTVTIAPAGIPSANQFGATSISSGAGAIAPVGVASTNQFGTATITPGPATIAPAGIASTNQFGNLTIAGSGGIAPSGIPPTNQFGVAAVSAGAVMIALSGVGSTNQFGTPLITAGTVAIAPLGISSTSQVGALNISAGAVAIAPLGIPSTAVVGIPQLIQFAPAIAPVGIASTNQFGVLVIAGENTYQPPIFRVAVGQERNIFVAVSDRKISVVVND